MVEVTFASVVLLGAIMIMISMFNMSVSILSFTTTRSIATQIANEEVENARSMDYEQVVNTEPTQWPDDPSLDTSLLPPKYRDIDDASSPVLRNIATTATAGYLSVERSVIRKNSNFTIRKYVLWVSDGAVTQAYKRLVVKISWPSPGVKGEVVVVTNVAKSDAKEPRPSVSIAGVKSTNYNYFKGQSEDTTMGQDDSIRGPDDGVRTPTVYVRAAHNSAKATGISRVDFTLLSPSAAVLSTASDYTKDANGYFTWDLSTTSGSTLDKMGYVIKAVAVDTLGRSEVATMRINIDNTPPAEPSLAVGDAGGAAKRLRLDWTWDSTGDQVPFISRFIIMRRRTGTGGDPDYIQKAAVPGERLEFTDSGLEPGKTYSYYIKAVDTAGNVRYSENRDKERTGVSVDNISPNPVTTSTAAPATWKAVDLYWPPTTDDSSGSGIAAYMWYSSDNQVNWTIVGETTNLVGDPLYYRDTGLKPGKTYYYKCRAVDVEGNLSALGPEVSAATPMR